MCFGEIRNEKLNNMSEKSGTLYFGRILGFTEGSEPRKFAASVPKYPSGTVKVPLVLSKYP